MTAWRRGPREDRGLRFAPMRRRDLRTILQIEHQVFPEPWSEAVFASELALPTGRAYRVAWRGRDLAGYVGVMFVDDEAHVTTIAVAPHFQHQGVGTSLLLEVVQLSRSQGVRHLTLEVAAGNERAQALYRLFGFVPVGIRKGYYAKTGEDAYVMWAHDIDGDAYAERVAGIQAQLRSRP